MSSDVLDSLGLPDPPPGALARSEQLAACLRSRIDRAGGTIPFSDYMQAVLYEPGLGYYSANIGGFGPAGDFVTAPELAGVFGHCVGRQVATLLDAIGPDAVVLELGAGSGALAEALLRELSAAGRPIRYLILEPSSRLAHIQRRRLMPVARALDAQVHWLTGLPPEPIDGVVVANEVADALPVDRFQVAGGRPLPIHVTYDARGFRTVLGPEDTGLGEWLEALERRLGRGLDEGYRSEVCRWLPGWIRALEASVGRGAVLALDYGYEERDYYHPERVDGTLMCHYRHRAHSDPCVLPGLQDVTASVDFSALARAAHACGFDVAGYTTQAWFLIGNDLEGFMRSRFDRGSDYLALAAAARTLTLPGEMGERVKAMALAKGLDTELEGFEARDMRGRL